VKGTAGLLIVLGAVALSGVGQAFAAEPPELVKSFGPDGTEGTRFDRTGSVAVDQETHAVYVTDRSKGAVYKFDGEGNELSFGGSSPYISGNEISGLQFKEERGDGRNQIAVDSISHTLYVTDEEGATLKAFQENGEPYLFSAGSGAGTNEIGGFTALYGVAVDQHGDIYASDHSGAIKVFAASGEQITEFAATEPNNIAVDSHGVIFVVRGEELSINEVVKFTPSEFPVSPSTTYEEAPAPTASEVEVVTVAIDPATNDLYEALRSIGIDWYDEAGVLQARFAKEGEPGAVGGPAGLTVVSESKDVFVGNNTAETSEVEVFGPKVIPEGPPTIVATSVKDVSATAATLLAEINPNSFQTSYRFEYGLAGCATSVCASVPVGEGAIGGGHTPVSVAQSVTGLQPDTTYHYRVVAQNLEGTTEGADAVFTTQSPGLSFLLADNRAWEMVSPANKHEGRLVGSAWGLIQASSGGDTVSFLSKGSIGGELEGSRSPEAVSVLAGHGPEGWSAKDISTPNSAVSPVAVGDLGEYKLFDPELSRSVISPRSSTPLSAEASERGPYLREEGKPPAYRPLVTGKAGFANVPEGTEFGGKETQAVSGVSIVGASRDLGKVVLQSDVPLAEGAHQGALYEWADGQLLPVSLLPPSEGGESVLARIGGGSTRGAVSADGSRIFWSASATGGLYIRDTGTGESSRLDEVSGGSGAGTVEPLFQEASSDGQVIFFTDEQQLTGDASPSGADLYRCEVPGGSEPPACASLTNISAAEVPGTNSDVLGLIAGAAENGSRAYFVAKGVLTSAPNEGGESATAGQPNLYLWQEGEGVRFVARLSVGDSSNWRPFSGTKGDIKLTVGVSPTARYLAFESERPLTGYDSRDVASGQNVQEAFRYDAVTDRLACVSCIPTGARSHAGTLGQAPLVDPRGVWEGRRPAAILPQATAATIEGPALYRPRGVLDNGRVFFNAVDALVPGDSNGQWDVYEYEPVGVGDCTGSSGTAGVARSAGGCVALISSGTAEKEAGFMDASTSGNDVFFLTPARLSITDGDQELDVYDARVDGVTAVEMPRSECSGESCQSPAPGPAEASISSATFNGAGNIRTKAKRCRKRSKAVRHNGKTRCVPRKHKPKRSKKRPSHHHSQGANR
jgi:hypothetical protein